jgi:rare lipoprotein A
MKLRHLAALLAVLVVISGCGRKKRPAARVPAASGGAAASSPAPAPQIGATQTGIASWYGYPYHGRRSANGEVYDMEKLTAAHLTLPFETRVKVENLDNNRTVEVRVTDRGPFVEGRIIDLSKAAAREIDLLRSGVAPVRLTVSRLPDGFSAKDTAVEQYSVQAGVFREKKNAEELRRKLLRTFDQVETIRRGAPPLWRVIVGGPMDIGAAHELAARVRENSGDAIVVRAATP